MPNSSRKSFAQQASAYLKRRFGDRPIRRNRGYRLRANRIEENVNFYTPAVHAERMIILGRDMLDDGDLAPYLAYYLDNPWGKDDPEVKRTEIIDMLQIPTNLKTSDRWDAVATLLGILTQKGKTAHLKRELIDFLKEIAPDCATLKACVVGCEIPLSRTAVTKGTHQLEGEYFASGSNAAGQIRGFAESGINVGVAAKEVYGTTEDQKKRRKALKELKGKTDLSGKPIKVFIDSGAFSEVKYDAATNTFQDKKPITHQEWLKVFSLYNEIGNVLGNQAYIVAPDKIGDQKESLRRMKTYMPLLESPAVNVIAPIPPPPKGMMTYDRQIRKYLGNDFIRGIPMSKGKTSVPVLVKFVKDLYKDKSVPKPLRVHLLGKGLTSKAPTWTKHIRPELEKIDPQMDVTLDSVRLKSISSRGGSDGKEAARKRADKKRTSTMTEWEWEKLYKKELEKELSPLTRSRDRIIGEIIAASLNESEEFYSSGKSYAIPTFYETGLDPSWWLQRQPTPKKRILDALKKRFPDMTSQVEKGDDPENFAEIGMSKENIKLFRKDPTAFLEKYYVMEDGEISKYADLMEFLWGDAFLYLEYHRFLSHKNGIMMKEYGNYLIKNLQQQINEAVLRSLPPRVKGITLKNPRKKSHAQKKKSSL